MRAAVNHRFGPPEVLAVAEVANPVIRRGEVLVRVHAAAVTAADARIRGANFPKGFGLLSRLVFGITRPRRKVLGSAFSGVVAESNAADFAVGDSVAGMTGMRFGAHAEFVAVSAAKIARKPANVSHDEAAGLLFGGSTAHYFLHERTTIRAGQSVLINGASGAIGTNAVQLAKLAGANVTAVVSTLNVDLVRELGADHVIDYTQVDLAGLSNRYDVVLDTVGNISPKAGRSMLNPGGLLLLAAANLLENLQARGNVKAGPSPERVETFDYLLERVDQGEMTVVIDFTSGLDGIVAAHARIDSGRKRGNIIVNP